jgi:hypothetical protein
MNAIALYKCRQCGCRFSLGVDRDVPTLEMLLLSTTPLSTHQCGKSGWKVYIGLCDLVGITNHSGVNLKFGESGEVKIVTVQ